MSLVCSFGEGSDVVSLWETVLTWLDITACAVVLYGIAGTTAVVIGVVERRRNVAESGLWPMFWFATGGLLLFMAAGRASNVSDLLTDIGREWARSGGWYEMRRSLQAWVIGAVAAIWAATVAVAVWRVPERRRRYLPTAIIVFTLVCFAGIRLISLHQVDALFNNHDIREVTMGTIVEATLLLLFTTVSAWRSPLANSGRSDEQATTIVERDAVPPVSE